MDAGFLYYAFISYKHEDKQWAKWLKSRLQAYRLPIRTRKHNRSLPVRTTPIFYDKGLRPGLLDRQVRSEVQSSRFLIVVCSRAAKAEPEWLNKEINFFLEGGGDPARIIPVIVDKTEDPVAETFPSRLAELNAEESILGVSVPVSGKRETILKIVSCMQGIRTEELESEDRKRKIRHAQIISACVALAVAGTVIGITRFRELSREKAAEEAYKLMEMSDSAWDEGNRQDAMQYALDAIEKSPPAAVKARAERMLADTLHVYETNTFIQDRTIDADGYVSAMYMTEDGEYLLVDYADMTRLETYSRYAGALAVYSTGTGKLLWSSPYNGMVFRQDKFYLYRGNELTEVDLSTGKEIRKFTDEQEENEILHWIYPPGSAKEFTYCVSPDGRWIMYRVTASRYAYMTDGEKQWNFETENGFFDAVFLDNRRVLALGNQGIWMIDLETGEMKKTQALSEDDFTAPVRILPGKERIICFIKNGQYELDQNGIWHRSLDMNTLLSDGPHRINLSDGIAAAFWLDSEETTVMQIGCNGRVIVSGEDYRQTETGLGSVASICVNGSCPDWMAYTTEEEPYRIHLCRKHVNPDARPLKASFSCRSMQGGKYILEYGAETKLIRSSDRKILWSQSSASGMAERESAWKDWDDEYFDDDFDINHFDDEEDSENEWEDTEEPEDEFAEDEPEDEEPPAEARFEARYAIGCSADGTILYDHGGAYDTSTDTYHPLEWSRPENWDGIACFAAAPDGNRPAVHAAVGIADNEKIEVIVFHDLKEAWRFELPFPEGKLYDYAYVSAEGNGWLSFLEFGPCGDYDYSRYSTLYDIEECTLVMVNLYERQMSRYEMDTHSSGWLPDYTAGSDSKNPVCVFTDGDKIRVIRCADGKEIRTLDNPAGVASSYTVPIQNDRYLMVCTANKTTQYFMDADNGEILLTCKNSISTSDAPGLLFTEQGQYLYYAQAYGRDDSNLYNKVRPDGYRIDTQTWTVDRRIPLADTFIPEYGQVICADESGVNLYLYPLYTGSELVEKAKRYLEDASSLPAR